MQDFRNFPLYLTAQLWDQLQSTSATLSHLRKAELLCTYLVQSLGLRHASEPTQSVIVSLLGGSMQVGQQSALLQTIKSLLRTVVTRAKNMGVQLPANIYLDVLPAGQDALPAAYRNHLATLQIVPVPAGVNVDEIWQAARGTPLRSRNQQIVLQQAMQGQGLVATHGTVAMQHQIFAQTATMMAQAMVGVMQPRQEEASLKNLQIFQRPTAAETVGSHGDGLRRLLDRADTSSSNLSVASTPSRLEQSTAAAADLAKRDGARAAETLASVPAAVTASMPASPAVPASVLASDSGHVETKPSADVAASAATAQRDLVEIEARGNGASAPVGMEREQALASLPSAVAESVQKLAHVHYGKDLPEVPSTTGKKPRVKALKRPAAAVVLKKPASKEDVISLDEIDKSLAAASAKKRPAAAEKVPAVRKQATKEVPAVRKQAAKEVPAARKQGAKKGQAAQTQGAKKNGAVRKQGAKKKNALKPLSEKKRFQLQPNGCATCRGRRGCCRSCWEKRGFLVK